MFVEKSFALVYWGKTRARIEFRRIEASRRVTLAFPVASDIFVAGFAHFLAIARGHLHEDCIFDSYFNIEYLTPILLCGTNINFKN